MILPLRQCHYRTFIAIGFFLPIVFAFGLVARKPFPSLDPMHDGLSATPQKFPVPAWERADLFAKLPVRVRLLREKTDPGSLALAFSAATDYFVKPDLMVYWMAGNPLIGERLPEAAELLGGFDSAALPLPAEATHTNGVLVLFSLADNEIVGVSKSIQFNQPTP